MTKEFIASDRERIKAAWEGRISGCLLGKPVEMISMRGGKESLDKYLEESNSLPLRDYVNYIENEMIRGPNKRCCKGKIERAEQDDDITYTVLALMMLERYGLNLDTDHVARTWLSFLPAGATFTAEREAYLNLLQHSDVEYQFGGKRKFDLDLINDNEFNDWIGAQIRIDMYGWVLPGKPVLAADLARKDSMLSHRGCAVESSAYLAALGALVPVHANRKTAVEKALNYIDRTSGAFQAVQLGIENQGKNPEVILETYEGMSPVHSLNNLAIVVWAFLSFEESFDEAVGEAVSAGWDTDCNGASVGGLVGLHSGGIPDKWTSPWKGRVFTSISGLGELDLEELVDRTTLLVSKFSQAEDKVS